MFDTFADAAYGLTDCMATVECHELGLDDALTHDRHFEHEGFAILL